MAPIKLVISAPYPEGAVVALAKWASDHGNLSQIIMPSRAVARGLSRTMRLVGRPRVAERLHRGPADLLELTEIMPEFELRRLASKLPYAQRISPLDVENLKWRFDNRVSKRRLPAAEAVICMPAAALRTFESVEHRLRVYHEVDGHPRARNEILLSHYSADRARREIHRGEDLDRLEREIELADVILTPSAVVSNQMTAHGVPEGKIVQTSYGVDFRRFYPVASDRPRANVIRLIYVGQISLRKGLSFLYEAVKGLDVELRLFGPVVEPSLLKDLPSNVAYCGIAPHARLAAELSQADVFVFPTLEDACPLVILEATGCGLPVISTAAAGSTESLDEQDCTLVPPGSSSALRAAIRNIEPLSLANRMERANRIRERAAQNDGGINDWPGWASQIVSAIEQRVEALKE